MNRQSGRRLAVDLSQKLAELHVPMPWKTGADNLALQQVERGEQTGSSVSFIVMRHGAAAPLLHGQPWLRPIQRLHVRFFVHAQYDRLVRRIQVHSDYIRQLLHKTFVLGELESLHTVRLESVRIPNTGYGGVTNSHGFGHCPRRPVCCIPGRRVQRRRNNSPDLFCRQGTRTWSVRCIFGQSFRTSLLESLSPLHYRRPAGLQTPGNGSVGQTFVRQQADTCSQDRPLRTRPCIRPSLQRYSLFIRHRQSLGWFPHETENITYSTYCQDITVTLH